MRIGDSSAAGNSFEPIGSVARRIRGQEARPAGDVTFQTSSLLSVPDMLRLTESGNPGREAFLQALSQTLRSGLHLPDENALAEVLAGRAFEILTPTGDDSGGQRRGHP